MNQQETNQYLLTKIDSLDKSLKEHQHNGLNSSLIDFKNILFSSISQKMSFVSVADDGEVELAKSFGIGLVMIGTVDEAALFKFSTDGSVVLLANTTNVDDADTDGNLCIYDAGTKTRIKNRLGAMYRLSGRAAARRG